MDVTFENSGTWAPPEIGTNWLKGLADKYILINPVFCVKGRVCYWTCDFVATGDLFSAGTIDGAKVRADPFKYNNGVDIIAVPLTGKALKILYNIADLDSADFDIFQNVMSCSLELGKGNSTLL